MHYAACIIVTKVVTNRRNINQFTLERLKIIPSLRAVSRCPSSILFFLHLWRNTNIYSNTHAMRRRFLLEIIFSSCFFFFYIYLVVFAFSDCFAQYSDVRIGHWCISYIYSNTFKSTFGWSINEVILSDVYLCWFIQSPSLFWVNRNVFCCCIFCRWWTIYFNHLPNKHKLVYDMTLNCSRAPHVRVFV